MNPSDWIKAATLVTQHKQDAAMAERDKLSSMPLSQITKDDSSPPKVHYGMHMPIAASTPAGTDVHMHSSQQEDSYQQIIPGIPQTSTLKPLLELKTFLLFYLDCTLCLPQVWNIYENEIILHYVYPDRITCLLLH